MAALPPDAMGWSVAQVRRWAVEEVGIDEEDADKLKQQKIDGRALHTMTEVKLERCGIPIGPSSLLMEAIEGGGGGASSVTGECCRCSRTSCWRWWGGVRCLCGACAQFAPLLCALLSLTCFTLVLCFWLGRGFSL